MITYPDTLIAKLRAYLGPRNLRYFRWLKHFHGSVSPVLRLNRARKGIPVHPVHFREGMQIRNWLREQPECKTWTCEGFDNHWAAVVELAIA